MSLLLIDVEKCRDIECPYIKRKRYCPEDSFDLDSYAECSHPDMKNKKSREIFLGDDTDKNYLKIPEWCPHIIKTKEIIEENIHLINNMIVQATINGSDDGIPFGKAETDIQDAIEQFLSYNKLNDIYMVEKVDVYIENSNLDIDKTTEAMYQIIRKDKRSEYGCYGKQFEV